MRAGSGELRIGMIGAGTMAGPTASRSRTSPSSTRSWPCGRGSSRSPTSTATLATGLAERFGYERVDDRLACAVAADDIDLVVVCLPPVFNREVVLGRRGRRQARRVREAAGASAEDRRRDASRRAGRPACSTAWRPAIAGRPPSAPSPSSSATASSARSAACAPRFMLDYAADPDVPLLWRFRKDLAGGGIAIDTGYHLVDCARFLVGEIDTVQAFATTFIAERPLPGADAVGNRGGDAAGSAARRDPDRSTSRTRPPRWSPSRAGPTASSRPAASRSASACRSSSRSTDRSARPSGTSSGRTSSACACPATRPRSGSGGSS